MNSKNLNLFANLLLEYNKTHNISGARSLSEVFENIEDSIKPLEFIGDFDSLLDVGTGAGFPGLVMAIAKSNAKFFLCEPKQKRVAFLRLVKSKLKLENVEIIAKRVEQIEPFKVDIITSRAVANSKILIDLCKDFEKDSTKYLLFKGQRVQNEVEKLDSEYKIVENKKRKYLIIWSKNV